MRADARRVFTDPYHFVAIGFGSGLSPKAPGTAGSLAALPLFWLMSQCGWVIYGLIVVAVLVAGVFVCDRVARELNVKDPSSIVLDEFVGLWIALYLVPSDWYWVLAGFGLFRLFDVLKPWPVSYFDKHVDGGLGIMLDDVAAGLYAFALLQAAVFLLKVM